MDASKATRSSTTGHLLVNCPKMHPVVVSKAPRPRKPPPKKLHGDDGRSAALLDAPAADAPGANLKGAVDITSIVMSAVETKGRGAGKAAAEAEKLGPDFDDEDDVPPLL